MCEKRSGVTVQSTPLHQHDQVRYPSTSYNGQFCLLCFQPQPVLASLTTRIPTVSTVAPLLIAALIKDVPVHCMARAEIKRTISLIGALTRVTECRCTLRLGCSRIFCHIGKKRTQETQITEQCLIPTKIPRLFLMAERKTIVYTSRFVRVILAQGPC